KDPRVVGRCDHLLSDILLIAICTYITGETDYQNMYMFSRERYEKLKCCLLKLPNGCSSADTFERVFKYLDVDSLKNSLFK
ncbi:MAG: transposase family protein, partial [Cytophagaceae bacterium]|nr:transposase family protein [Cytophagaceae bacterium]